MARLAHTGYGLYNMGGLHFVVSPTKVEYVPEDILEHEYTAIVESATEHDEWIDHKINWSIILYGTEVDPSK